MIKIIHRALLVILLITTVNGQVFRLSKPSLDSTNDIYEGLPSNGVTQIVPQGDSLIWFATGGGLCWTTNFGETFWHYVGNGNLPKGGISAIETLGSVIWVAGVFDSTTNLGTFQTGGGLAYSKNYGASWTYVPQPIDTVNGNYKYQVWNGDTVSFLAIKTPINNTTWDIALDITNGDTVVYITSWAGGLRRSKDFGTTWESIPLPSDDLDLLLCSDAIDFVINPQDPDQGGNHNHKGFSVIAYGGDTLWVGTADGVNLGVIESDNCIRWQKYNALNSNLSGNFVIALARQRWNGRETIWAGALTAEGASEIQAACRTYDGGQTWHRTLIGERVYGFAARDSIIYVCTERGLFKSRDGENWALYNPMYDEENNAYILSQDVYAAFVDTRTGQSNLWLGTSDGIAKTASDGENWAIYHRSLSTSYSDQPAIYAYPNPFVPALHNVVNGDGHVRIQYYLDEPAVIQLEIYDFAMDLVYKSEPRSITHLGDNSEIWNGKNRAGNLVANGTYFCKLIKKTNDKKQSDWTKLIVIK
jgi:hypothetical protein